MTRLEKRDWNQLDNLLRKIGFGGYYDLVELIQINILRVVRLNPKYREPLITRFEVELEEESNLHTLVLLLTEITSRLE